MSELEGDDVSGLVDIMRYASKRLQQLSAEMERFADSTESKKDLTYAAEAVTILASAAQQCRIDLFITRPLRALGR